MALLEIKNLSVDFGGIKAIENLSISVDTNQFLGLMGPNGAGKTTLINCISRIVNVSHGQIIYDGHDLLKLAGHQMIDLGISRTFQDLSFYNLIGDMLVIDYMKLGQFSRPKVKSTFWSNHGEKELQNNARRILEFFADIREQLEPPQKDRGYPAILGRAGFPDLLDVEYQPMSSLSFAWRRRLDLARALVSKPKLLLLDEPMQGLPPSEIENLAKVLKLIKTEFGVSALIVEHNVNSLMNISDAVVAMNYGKKITEGLPEDVRNNKEVIEIYLGTTEHDENSPPVITVSDSQSSSSASVSDEPDENQVPLLEIKNIDLFYGHAQALFGVSLKLYPNQVACVLGTNGSGKSTLLKVISGTEKPSNGEIFYKGEFFPMGWPEAAVDRGIQYVPQGHIIFPRLTVKENLKIGSFSLAKRGLTADIDKAYYYFPQLKTFDKKMAGDLSGGQQQMLAIGQAIIGQPELLLLDEPSLGLAPKFVELLFQIIRKISLEEKCAILLVEQSVARSIEVSDYIYMMSTGVMVGKGSKKVFAKDDSLIRKNLGFY